MSPLNLGGMLPVGRLLIAYGFEFEAPVELFRGGRRGQAEGHRQDLFQSPVRGDGFRSPIEPPVAAHEPLVEGLDDAVRLDAAKVGFDRFAVASIRLEPL